MVVGSWFTTTFTVLAQPVLVNVYDTIVVPATSPLTTPVLLIVAAVGLVLLHTPPVLVVLSVVVLPTHTCAVPVIVLGSAFTVIVVLLIQPVPTV